MNQVVHLFARSDGGVAFDVCMHTNVLYAQTPVTEVCQEKLSYGIMSMLSKAGSGTPGGDVQYGTLMGNSKYTNIYY